MAEPTIKQINNFEGCYKKLPKDSFANKCGEFCMSYETKKKLKVLCNKCYKKLKNSQLSLTKENITKTK